MDDSFTPESSLREIRDKIQESIDQSEPVCHTREICDVWSINPQSKHILVPYIQNGTYPVDYFLRIYKKSQGVSHRIRLR